MSNHDSNGDVLVAVNLLDKIMRDKNFSVEQRMHDLGQIAAFALKFRSHLSQVNNGELPLV